MKGLEELEVLQNKKELWNKFQKNNLEMEGQMLKHLVTGQKSSNFQHPLRTTLFPFFQQKKTTLFP